MIFDADGSFIENKATGECIALKRKNGTFMVEMQVGPEEDEDDAMGTNLGFPSRVGEASLHRDWSRQQP